MFLRPIFRLASLFVCSGAAVGQQFTADLVHLKPPSDIVTKVFVSGDKMRLETTSQEHSGVVIMDLEKRTSLMLVPASKTYVAWPAGRAQGPMPFFHPKDADNACDAWEKLVNKPGTCAKIGDETIHGRSAVKYKGIAQNGDTGYAWVDRHLMFVTKWEGEKTAAEFKTVQEGPQAASLFTVPSDYEKIDVPQAHKGSKAKKAKPRVVSPPQNP